MAEITLTRLDQDERHLDPVLVESLADLLFEIGNDRKVKLKHAEAVQWLEKAQEILSSCSLDALSSDAGELHIAIKHSLVQALASLPKGSGNKEAWNVLEDLDAACKERLPVQLLRLQILSTEPDVSYQEYCDILLRVVRTIHLTDANLRTILHHVHRLRSKKPNLAHVVLRAVLLERLTDAKQLPWVEKVLVTVIWNLTMSTEPGDELDCLSQLLISLEGNLEQPIGPSATHAAQMVRISFYRHFYLH